MSNKTSELINMENVSEIKKQRPVFRAWRMLNTVVLLLGLFAPWVKGCDANISGTDLAKISGPIFMDFFQQNTVFWREDMLYLAGIILADAILAFVILNTVYAIFSAPGKIWHRIALIVAIGSLSIVFFQKPTPIESFLWGFWFTCGGIFSAVLVEIFSQLEPNPTPRFRVQSQIVLIASFGILILLLLDYLRNHYDFSPAPEKFQLTELTNPPDCLATGIPGVSYAKTLQPKYSDQIAYLSDRYGNTKIFLVNANGFGQHTLIANTQNDLGSSLYWSPDGTKIVFYRLGGSGHYYIADIASHHICRTAISAGASMRGWLPDSKHIIYKEFNGKTPAKIYTALPDGSEKKVWFEKSMPYPPILSPDGLSYAFISYGETSIINISIMNIDSSNLRIVANGSSSGVDWSPDGKQLVFCQGTQIYTINIDGTDQKEIANQAIEGLTRPQWSPDGKWIIFESDKDGNQEIYRIDADGRNLVRLTNNTTADYKPIWSPDGQKIVFVSRQNDDAELYIMNSDGTWQTRLTYNTGINDRPSWQP